MTLDELKAMREKSDEIVATLRNDREVLISTKQERIENNTKDLQEFLDSLKEYAKLLPENNTKSICTYPLFRQFEHHAKGRFWEEDTRVSIYDNKIHFLISGGDECFIIDITKDCASLFIPSNKHSYSHLCFEDFKKFILEHKADVQGYVEKIIEQAIEDYVNINKVQNDKLYEDIERLSD